MRNGQLLKCWHSLSQSCHTRPVDAESLLDNAMASVSRAFKFVEAESLPDNEAASSSRALMFTADDETLLDNEALPFSKAFKLVAGSKSLPDVSCSVALMLVVPTADMLFDSAVACFSKSCKLLVEGTCDSVLLDMLLGSLLLESVTSADAFFFLFLSASAL